MISPTDLTPKMQVLWIPRNFTGIKDKEKQMLK